LPWSPNRKNGESHLIYSFSITYHPPSFAQGYLALDSFARSFEEWNFCIQNIPEFGHPAYHSSSPLIKILGLVKCGFRIPVYVL
jgi:hypothetical protein